MADPKIVKEWLTKADEDFDFAKANLEEDSKFYSQISFNNKILTINNKKTRAKLYSKDISKINYRNEMDTYNLNFICDRYNALFENKQILYDWFLG